MNLWFLAASLCSFSVCLTHIFLGGKEAARPLLATKSLRAIPKYTNYYCWHMVSIVIAGLGVMFLIAAFWLPLYALAWAASIFAALFSLWNMGLYVWKRSLFRHWYELPQWALFLPITILGFVGIMNG